MFKLMITVRITAAIMIQTSMGHLDRTDVQMLGRSSPRSPVANMLGRL